MNWLLAAAAFAAASTYQATSPLAPAVRDLAPAPGTTVKAFFPRLSATITTRDGRQLKLRSLHLYVDGRDVTTAAAVTPRTVQYVPHQRMQAGWHDAFIEGADAAGASFSDAWVFQTQDPDIDLPIDDDDGFAFLPVGPNNGPFTHFFFLSPFDGFGFVQFCGLEFPLTRVIGTPVFFVTAPVTLGTVLLGCTPGIVFTPFQAGIGELNPIFFPIGAAGPGFFGGGPHHGRRHPLAPGKGGMPVYRTAPAVPMPVTRTPVMPMPIRRAPVMPMPINRAPVMPVPVHGAPVIRPPHVPVRCCTHAR